MLTHLFFSQNPEVMKLFNQGIWTASCWKETKPGTLEFPASVVSAIKYIDIERIEYADYIRFRRLGR